MNSWKQDASLKTIFENATIEDIKAFLQNLSESRWSESFVLRGDFLTKSILGEVGRSPKKLVPLSRICPKDAMNAVEEIAGKSKINLNSDAEGEGIELNIGYNYQLPSRPQLRDIMGAQIPCVSIETLISEMTLSLVEDINSDNAMFIYDVAALAQSQNIDGRKLYEALFQNFSCISKPLVHDEIKFVKKSWIIKCIYDYNLDLEGLKGPEYHHAFELCKGLLDVVLDDVNHENEFFGLWSPNVNSWLDYQQKAEA